MSQFGEYFIDTELNTEGVKKGAQDISNTMEKVADDTQKSLDKMGDSQQLDKTAQSINKVADEMERVAEVGKSMNASSISPEEYMEAYEALDLTKHKTQEEIDKLVEARVQAQGLADDLNGTTIDTTGAKDLASPDIDMSALEEYLSMPDTMERKLEGLKANIADAFTPIHNAIADHERLANTVELVAQTFGNMNVGKAVLTGIGTAAKIAVGGVVSLGEALLKVAVNGGKAVAGKIVSGFKKLGTAALNGAKNILTMHKSNNKLTGSFKKGFWTLLKYGIGIRSLYILFRKLRTAIKDGMGNLAKEDSKTNASISGVVSALATLKNALATAFAPIVNVVAPILTGFINQLVSVANTIGAVMAKLTGAGTFQKAIGLQKDYAKSLGKTGKSAQNATLSIDELNQSVDDSESGGGGGAQDMFAETPIDTQASDFADRLKDMWANADFTDLGAIFGEKIANALDGIKWGKIKATAGKIGKSIATFINGFVEFPDLGYKIGNALAQSFNTALEFCYQFVTNLHWNSVGKFIGDAINGSLLNIDWKKLAVTISEGLKGWFTLITESLKTINWQDIGRKIAEFIRNIDYKGIAQTFFTLLGTAFSSAVEFVYGFIQDAVKGIKDYFQKYIDEYIATTGDDNLGHAIIAGIFNGIVDALKNIYEWIRDNIFLPFINAFKDSFAIHSPSKVMKTMGGYIVDGLFNGIKNIWERTKAIFEDFKAKVKAKVDEIKGSVQEKFTTMKTNVQNTIADLKTNVLSIFNRLKSALKTPINGIIEMIESMINGIANGFNRIADGIKDLTTFEWTNPFSGKVHTSSGLSLPRMSTVSLPRLATGTVIPRQASEFAAILGDNNSETEVVSPLSTIREAVADVMQDYLAEIAENTRNLVDKDYSVTIGDREIARANNRGQKLLGYQLIH